MCFALNHPHLVLAFAERNMSCSSWLVDKMTTSVRNRSLQQFWRHTLLLLTLSQKLASSFWTIGFNKYNAFKDIEDV
jgi:hypothetical protein